jgi:hypothetical protein
LEQPYKYGNVIRFEPCDPRNTTQRSQVLNSSRVNGVFNNMYVWRLSTISSKNFAFFLENQSYDAIIVQTSAKSPFLQKKFGENNLKIVTAVPGSKNVSKCFLHFLLLEVNVHCHFFQVK